MVGGELGTGMGTAAPPGDGPKIPPQDSPRPSRAPPDLLQPPQDSPTSKSWDPEG